MFYAILAGVLMSMGICGMVAFIEEGVAILGIGSGVWFAMAGVFLLQLKVPKKYSNKGGVKMPNVKLVKIGQELFDHLKEIGKVRNMSVGSVLSDALTMTCKDCRRPLAILSFQWVGNYLKGLNKCGDCKRHWRLGGDPEKGEQKLIRKALAMRKARYPVSQEHRLV